ncbi:MAG: hypothetical protein ACN2B6_00245 [Rickettsiales bacterium]
MKNNKQDLAPMQDALQAYNQAMALNLINMRSLAVARSSVELASAHNMPAPTIKALKPSKHAVLVAQQLGVDHPKAIIRLVD